MFCLTIIAPTPLTLGRPTTLWTICFLTSGEQPFANPHSPPSDQPRIEDFKPYKGLKMARCVGRSRCLVENSIIFLTPSLSSVAKSQSLNSKLAITGKYLFGIKFRMLMCQYMKGLHTPYTPPPSPLNYFVTYSKLKERRFSPTTHTPLVDNVIQYDFFDGVP